MQNLALVAVFIATIVLIPAIAAESLLTVLPIVTAIGLGLLFIALSARGPKGEDRGPDDFFWHG